MSTGPGLDLDEQLCFAVYAASRALSGCYRAVLSVLGLTYPQYLVLLVLWEADPASVGELGERLQLDTGTLSPLLQRLERGGLLTRSRSRVDERQVEVALTPAGRALREQAAAVPSQIAAATGLEPAELAGLRDSLHALTSRLRSPERP